MGGAPSYWLQSTRSSAEAVVAAADWGMIITGSTVAGRRRSHWLAAGSAGGRQEAIMSLKRRAAAPQKQDEDSPAAADGQGSPAIGSAEADSGPSPRSPEEIAAEVAEAVIWNYQGKDPDIALAGLAEFLEKKGQSDSELAEVVAELRAILHRRLPPGRPVN